MALRIRYTYEFNIGMQTIYHTTKVHSSINEENEVFFFFLSPHIFLNTSVSKLVNILYCTYGNEDIYQSSSNLEPCYLLWNFSNHKTL